MPSKLTTGEQGEAVLLTCDDCSTSESISTESWEKDGADGWYLMPGDEERWLCANCYEV